MKNKPNFIVFMTDQQNAQSVNPDSPVKTPNIDRFLNKAVLLEENYCPAPHCCPCRASFFSSLMPSQHGVWNNVDVDNTLSRGLYDDVTLFPEILKENGYRNIFSGKWHVSAVEGPSDRAFDEVLHENCANYANTNKVNIPHASDWDNHYNNKINIDSFIEAKEIGKIIRPGYPHYYHYGANENPFDDANTVQLACDRITNYDSNQPFFMYIGTTGPHDPYTPPQRFIDMYDINDIELPASFHDEMKDKPALYRRTKDQFNSLTEDEHKQCILRYYALCSYEDYLFGKVLDAVEEKEIADNTIIIYLTDHGDYLGAHGLWTKGLPCFKEAYNICGIIGGGDINGGKKINEFTSILDFYPTILDFANISIPKNIKGYSIKDIIYGNSTKSNRPEMYTQTNGNEIYGIQRSVFNKEWKYVLNTFDYDELYDLENDPNEMNNLFGKNGYEDIVKELCKKVWKFAKDNQDNCTNPYVMVSLAPYGPGIINFD